MGVTHTGLAAGKGQVSSERASRFEEADVRLRTERRTRSRPTGASEPRKAGEVEAPDACVSQARGPDRKPGDL